MDQDKVVTPMDLNTLEQITGFDGTKSKESELHVLSFKLVNLIVIIYES